MVSFWNAEYMGKEVRGMRENTSAAKSVAVNALCAALVCISTMVIQIPIPLGYMHLGNACILLVGALFGPLTGYTQWVIPTILIKSVMGFVIGYLAWGSEKKMRMTSPRTFLATAAGVVVMVFGYTIAGAVMNGSIYTGLLQVPGLTVEGVLGAVCFYSIGIVLEKAHVLRILTQ